ncbi:uncharacterized protein [Apostichopus japonicus]|uniref:uncharacterized protein n=1 Tax=Stichopus japonicus TaxID=307972 RepID=UPI003AB2D8C7
MLRLDLNFTELTTNDDVRRSPFVYSGMFWDEDLRYDRYLFQVEYIPWNSSAYCYNFSFRIRDIQTEDAGTYNVNLRGIYYDWTAGPMLFQHKYRLFVYQPTTPIVCQGPSSSPSGSYHVTISCSITDGFPPINLEMIEPEGCAFQKHYTDVNGIRKLSINVTSCNQNSNIGCIATQVPLELLSTPQYSGRCGFNISKSIPDGYQPINLEVIKPEGCDYHEYYTNDNGTKELSVYVTSCDQNSTIGCIATQEPFQSLSTSQYSQRCEFNISKTDQEIVGCSFHCFGGPDTNKSTDCYVIAGCDFSFPDVPIYGNYKRSLSLSINYSDDTRSDSSSRRIYKYNGKFWFRDIHTVDRFSFEVIRKYLQEDNTPSDNLRKTAACLSFTIEQLSVGDAGSYHVTLIGETTEDAIVQYNYRLFTIYQPPTPLLCEKQDLSKGSSIYKFSIICSVSDAYPSVVIDMIEPKGCSYYKSYSRDDDIKTLTVYISTCDVNSTVGCTATQGELDFMSTIPYSNSCFFDIPKDYPDTNNIMKLVMIVCAVVLVLSVIIIVDVYR